MAMRRILSRAWIFGQPSMRRSVRTGRRSRADTDSWVREVAPHSDSWNGLAAQQCTAQQAARNLGEPPRHMTARRVDTSAALAAILLVLLLLLLLLLLADGVCRR